MPFLRPTVLIATALASYGVVQALVGARELASVAPTTRQPELPASSAMGVLGFAVMLLAYGLLGRAIARAGLSAGLAARRGATAGALAGLASGFAQAALQADFFRAVALAYSLPEIFAQVLVATIVATSPIVGAAIGAVVTWLAALLSRPRPEELV